MAWTRLFVCLAYRTEAWADQLARKRKRRRIRQDAASLDLRYFEIRTMGPKSQHWKWDQWSSACASIGSVTADSQLDADLQRYDVEGPEGLL